MTELTIRRADNGYVLTWPDDPLEDGTLVSGCDVIEDAEGDELKSGEALLWWVIDYFGLFGSRYDKERLRAVRVPGDKYEAPKKSKKEG